MNIFLAPNPRKLFYCCKCRRSPDGLKAEAAFHNAPMEVTVYCHGESDKVTTTAEILTPIKVFKEAA